MDWSVCNNKKKRLSDLDIIYIWHIPEELETTCLFNKFCYYANIFLVLVLKQCHSFPQLRYQCWVCGRGKWRLLHHSWNWRFGPHHHLMRPPMTVPHSLVRPVRMIAFTWEFTALQWIPVLLLSHVSTSTSFCAGALCLSQDRRMGYPACCLPIGF